MAQQIACGNNVFAIVDNEDSVAVCLLGSWHLSSEGYPRSKKNGKMILLHLFIAKRMRLKGEIDHKDRNPLNALRSNLREATRTQQGMNSTKRNGTSSKYKGVTWDIAISRWRATIQVHGQRKYLGIFKKETEAAEAYDIAAQKYFGQFAVPNLGRIKE